MLHKQTKRIHNTSYKFDRTREVKWQTIQLMTLLVK